MDCFTVPFQHTLKNSIYFLAILQSDMIMKSMLKPVRRNANLGDPPEAYYNNVPEAANAMIKRAVNFKENDMPGFCNKMSTLILQQKEDVESAVFNHLMVQDER